MIGCQLFCKLNMPNPSLLLHYRELNTTTIWSAANISDPPDHYAVAGQVILYLTASSLDFTVRC
ncbi:MAG: hypothetical protein IPJ13_16205 [Saprospiraceae bacterium]|nr:hypothetical protein [Saprospiraceae bacterium]